MNPARLARLLLTFLFVSAATACAPLETQKAEEALTTWRNKRPTQYTYVLEPTGWNNPAPALRIAVRNEDVLAAVERDGHEATADRLSMTGLLEDALAASDEDSFSASYDPELGYVKSFFYAPGPDEEAGGYGFEVPCFEPSLDDAACAEYFPPSVEP